MLVKIGDTVTIKEDLFFVENIPHNDLLTKKELDNIAWLYLVKGTVMTAMGDGELQEVEWKGGDHCCSLSESWIA